MNVSTTPKLRLTPDHLLKQFKEMIRIRRFEEKAAELYTQEKIRGFLHLYVGEEAVAVGVMSHLQPQDSVIATYREHGHALARGVPMKRIMAEMYGKAEGCCGGRGGSMHLFDIERRFYGGYAIVGGGLPIAVGLALADKMRGQDRVTVCFFGEGAVAEGEFHESMNLAALWQLPVLFVCENNLYAMGTALARSESQTDIHIKAQSYSMPAQVVDGMSVVEVEAAAAHAVDAIRAGQGPQFIECRTYRFRAHSMFDPQRYRDKTEVEHWRLRDPILQMTAWLQQINVLHADTVETLEKAVDQEIEEAVAFAEESPWEPEARLTEHVLMPWPAPPPFPSPASLPGKPISIREAYHDALEEALKTDERVFMMGEDIGRYGGTYAVTLGLLEAFGPERVRDTPLSESAFVGAGIGAAINGMRPIVEVMTVNFSLLALDQIVNNAAVLHHMSGGQINVPVVIRMATGAGRQLAAQHSHSLEGWYAHVPGLKVLAPATAADARFMLRGALADPNPVILFEHVMLYSETGPVDADHIMMDIHKAAIRRPGKDVTLITYGGSLPKTLAAAEELAKDGIDAEVIDLRCLRPLDAETLVASVSKTHRAVVIDENWYTGGLAAEISALIMDRAFWSLDAPVRRVCTQELPIPYARHLEIAALPQVAQIVEAARALRGSPDSGESS